MSSKARSEGVTAVQAEIGQRILWARELVEPNRSAFARAVALDPSTVTKIEQGARPPSAFNLIAFAARLRVSTEYILRGSLLGVDAELAARLLAAHPELASFPQRIHASGGTSSTAPADDKNHPPTRRGCQVS